MSDIPCLFCRIAAGELPAQIIYEDESILVFEDKYPKARIHWLAIPRHHVENWWDVGMQDGPWVTHLVVKLAQLAQEAGLPGFKWQVNNGAAAGQEVPHLHIHLLAN